MGRSPRADDTAGRPARARSGLVWIAIAAALAATLVAPMVGLLILGAVVAAMVLRTRADAFTLLLLYVGVLLLVPSRFTLGPLRFTAAMVVAGVGLLLWVGGKLVPGSRLVAGGHRVVTAAGGFFFVMLVTYAFGHTNPMTSGQLRAADRHTVALLLLVAVTALAADAIDDSRRLHRVLVVLTGCGGVVAVIAILQFTLGIDLARYLQPPGFQGTSRGFILRRAGFSRVAGTARHPIELGVAAATILPSALYLGFYAKGARTRQGAAIVAVLLALMLPMTLSRSAVLGLAAALLLLLPSWRPHHRFRIVIGVIAIFVASAVVAPGLLPTVGDLLSGEKSQGSNQARSAAAESAMDIVGESPIIGHGFGSFDESAGVIVDNLYLVMLIEGGAVGLAALIGLFLFGFGTARRARRRTKDPALRNLAQTVAAMIVVLAVGGFGLNLLRSPLAAGLLFLAIGLAGAVDRMASAEVATAARRARRARGPATAKGTGP